MLYFHGIKEQLSHVQLEMNYIRRECKINVLGVEYPTFGVHWDEGICTFERMISDAKQVL